MFRFIILGAVLAAVSGAPQTAITWKTDGRIIGGHDTTIEEHPYIVAILLLGSQSCGGTIISPNWIVSAAHCFSWPVSFYSIRAGSSFRTQGGEIIPVRSITIPPGYSGRTLDYDIALLELSTPISIPVARSIGLAAEGGPPPAGTNSVITGWGTLREGGSTPNILQVVQVPIIDRGLCREMYRDFILSVTDTMLCAGLVGVGGKDACQGDSGGPLVANGVLTGVVSWGDGCARADAPGVYASIPDLRSWIRGITGI